MQQNRRFAWILVVIVVACLVASGVRPYDRTIWVLEVAPVLVLLPLGAWSIPRYPLSRLSYIVATIGALLMIVGAHYSYARVPVGEWVQIWLDLSRNHYDRLGHFFQGLVPALILRELLVRFSEIENRKLLFVVAMSMTVALSAGYEMIEWLVHAIGSDRVSPFLGAQGDRWDAQWDMFMALCGSIIGLLTLARTQDRQLGHRLLGAQDDKG